SLDANYAESSPRTKMTENRGPQLCALSSSFLALAWITVLARCWVRLRFVKSFGLDDWLMVAALVCSPHPLRTRNSGLIFTASVYLVCSLHNRRKHIWQRAACS